MISLEQLYQHYLRHPNVCTDTRKLVDGDLFFALVGDRFDGNKFALQALESGAAYAVVSDPDLEGKHPGILLVEDTLVTLQDLSRHHRRQLSAPVIGITGSNGKTTTKELVSSVLAGRYPMHATIGNFNNHIGVPLSLLQARKSHEVLVIEMGANAQGEIDFLSHIAEPSHGLITNIGKAHLEGFGGVEGVKKGKSELYRFLAKTGGIAFVNKEEKFLEDLSQPVEQRIFYGAGTGTFETILLEVQPFLKVQFGDEVVQTQLSGEYNFPNICTAVALGRYFKVSDASIAKAISEYVPSNNRSQWMEYKGAKVLLDAYNANPTSMQKSLEAFAERPGGNKWAILGDMFELGEYSQQEHERLLKIAQSQNLTQLVLVGEAFSKCAVAKEGLQVFSTADAAMNWWQSQDLEGAEILLKASRGIGLERLIKLP